MYGEYLIITLIIVAVVIYYVYSPYNYRLTKPCYDCETFKVSDNFEDKGAAAMKMQSVNDRILKLLDYLQHKYVQPHLGEVHTPAASTNRSAVQPMRRLATPYAIGSNWLYLLGDTNIEHAISNMREHFSGARFYENSPYNLTNSTAYTDNKNTLYLCLRDKLGKLYDIDTLMFVALHELTHMMDDEWGHGGEFWLKFKFLLLNAEQAGLYKPVDYSIHNLNYCGLELTNNPYY